MYHIIKLKNYTGEYSITIYKNNPYIFLGVLFQIIHSFKFIEMFKNNIKNKKIEAGNFKKWTQLFLSLVKFHILFHSLYV